MNFLLILTGSYLTVEGVVNIAYFYWKKECSRLTFQLGRLLRSVAGLIVLWMGMV